MSELKTNSGKLGIDHIKAAVLFAITFGKTIGAELKDGFQVVPDLVGLIPSLMQLPEIIKSGSDLVAEWKDRDEEEKTELKNYIKDNFDIPDDKIEELIERSGNLVIEIMDYSGFIKQYFTK